MDNIDFEEFKEWATRNGWLFVCSFLDGEYMYVTPSGSTVTVQLNSEGKAKNIYSDIREL